MCDTGIQPPDVALQELILEKQTNAYSPRVWLHALIQMRLPVAWSATASSTRASGQCGSARRGKDLLQARR